MADADATIPREDAVMTSSDLQPSDSSVIISYLNGVATVTLNNPSRRNALTPTSADQLVRTFDDLDMNQEVGAVVIKGSQGSFCSGADLGSLGAAMGDPASEPSYDALERIYRAFTRFGELSMPTIAAIRGSVVGAGLNMALAADVRIMAKDARIISGFSKLGLHPGGGHFQLIAGATNRQAAAAIGVFSQEIDGVRAQQLGFAWEALDDWLVEERAQELAEAAGADPELSRRSVQSLRTTTPPAVPWSVALQAERSVQMWSLRRAAFRRASKLR